MPDLRGFDANQVEPTTDFEPIPAGKYLAVITDSELKPNKANTGHYLQLAFQIIEGPCKNRFVWARLNLDHPNATAVQIARAELSAICRAVGVLAPKDSIELHNLPLVIRFGCKNRIDKASRCRPLLREASSDDPAGLPAGCRDGRLPPPADAGRPPPVWSSPPPAARLR